MELLTGHGNLRNMLRKKGQSQHSICRVCRLAEESAEHLLESCIGTIQERAKHGDKRGLEQSIEVSLELMERDDINRILREPDSQYWHKVQTG